MSIKNLRIFIIFIIIFMFVGCKKKETTNIDDYEINKKENYTQVGKDIIVFKTSFYDVNVIVIKSNKEAILIDTGTYNSDALKVQNYLKDNHLKLKKIIITHMHGDHSRNLNSFKNDDIEVITPNTASDEKIIELGNKTLKIIFTDGHYGPHGHISVVVNDEILVAGDVVCNNILPPVSSGGNIHDLLDTLTKIKNNNYQIIIPGHGDIESTEVILNKQFEYLNNAKDFVEEIINNNGTEEDLKNIKLEDCLEDTSNLYPERLDYWHLENLKTIYNQLIEKE